MNRISNRLAKLQEDPADKVERKRLDELAKDVEFATSLTLRLLSNGTKIEYAFDPAPTTSVVNLEKNQITVTFAAPHRKFGFPFVHVEARIDCGNALEPEMKLPAGRAFTEPTRYWPADDPLVTTIIRDVLPEKTCPLVAVERIIDWIRFQKHIIPDTAPEGSRGTRYGTVKVLKQGFGNCWDYSDVFITLCRAAGVPSRQVAGWRFGRGGHVWAEVYLENLGWIQLDPTTGFTATDDYIAYFTSHTGDMPIVYVTWPKTEGSSQRLKAVGDPQPYPAETTRSRGSEASIQETE